MANRQSETVNAVPQDLDGAADSISTIRDALESEAADLDSLEGLLSVLAQGKTARHNGAAETEIRVLDDQGSPLIPHEQLPFVDNNDPVRSGVKWGPVPTNYYDALRYGRDMALALLRVAPRGCRTRSDDIEVFGAIYLLEQQIASQPKPHSNSGTAVYKFWSTLLHFIMMEPTHENVEHFRLQHELEISHEEIDVLRERLKRLIVKHRRPGGARRAGKAVRP